MDKRIALVGYGYWGPNLLRNLSDTPGCEIAYCCDKDQQKLRPVKKRYPGIEVTVDFNRVIKDKTLDAIVLATPTKTHFALAKKALSEGKDVLMEKPMTLRSEQAGELAALAKRNRRILMVDHTFLFNDAVVQTKKIIDKNEIGDILYIDSVRVNLGLFQKDSNVIYDLASHDFSIIQYFLGNNPISVLAYGDAHFSNFEDMAYISAEYPTRISAHVHVSWLSPVKIRRMLIVGTKKMVVYDDIEPTEKIRIYDSGVTARRLPKDSRQIKIGYRSGDVWIPRIDIVEPLSFLVREFVNALHTRKSPKSNGEFGVKVVETLEGATKSARSGRKVVLKNASNSRS